MRASRQVGDNIARPSIDNFEREPGRQPGVLLLPLHSTLLPPKSLGTTDATRTLIISLPPLNPPLQCASRQDEDNDYVPARPWLNPDTGGIALLRSETILVRRDTMEALLCTVRTLWSTPPPPTAGIMVGTFGYLCAPMPWSVFCNMVVDVSNHRGWDPRRDFWRSLHHHQVAPPRHDIDVDFDGRGTAGSKGVPIDESIDDDLPPLSESSDDDQD